VRITDSIRHDLGHEAPGSRDAARLRRKPDGCFVLLTFHSRRWDTRAGTVQYERASAGRARVVSACRGYWAIVGPGIASSVTDRMWRRTMG
jgi:hypothetical protein